MKIKKGFNLRTICGEQIIVAEGIENIDFSKIISLNESSAYLWNAVAGKDFTAEDLANLLSERYEVDEATALADAKEISQKWVEVGIVDA